MRLRFLAVLAALGAAACARNIPNTEIQDTPDNRAIIAVVDAYRKAFDAMLPQVLKDTFSRINQVRLEFGITDIIVNGDRAQADCFYDAKYRVLTPRSDIAKRDTDIQRILLQRQGKEWKIISGL